MRDVTLSTNVCGLSPEDESLLVELIKDGNQKACTKLFTLFGPRMMSIARRFLRCEDDCNDAVQDAFISAFKALDQFDGDARLSTWLHRITVNACLMKLRLASSRRETSIEEMLSGFTRSDIEARAPAAMNDPPARIEIDETRAMVRQAIDKLSRADRAVLLLRDIEQMDTAATAARLDTSEHNVKRRLRRARQSLFTRLEPFMVDHGSCSYIA